LCLGEVKVHSNETNEFVVKIPYEGKMIFFPYVFYLCSTVEYIKVPETHCAFIQMRSSLARRGLGHKMAGFVDPGFEGEITLELEPSLSIEVKRGERIVQVIYQRLSEKSEKGYRGRYFGQIGAREAY